MDQSANTKIMKDEFDEFELALNFAPKDQVVTDSALTVSGGATPSLTITDIECGVASQAVIIVNNKGAGTTVSAKVYGKIGDVAYTDKEIVTALALTATAGAKCQAMVINPCPYDKIKVVVTNGDAANATTVDVAVRIVRKA